MADCEETLRELELFLDGEMSADELAHVRLHLNGCLDCLHVFDFHAELREVIRTKCQEQELPAGLAERVKNCFGDDVVEQVAGAAEPGDER
jgi:anti-sigma factor (TIGR02949 family)